MVSEGDADSGWAGCDDGPNDDANGCTGDGLEEGWAGTTFAGVKIAFGVKVPIGVDLASKCEGMKR